MASITHCGFCVVAALSRYTRGWPAIFWDSAGKSSRRRSAGKASPAGGVSAIRLRLAGITAGFVEQATLSELGHIAPPQTVTEEQPRKQQIDDIAGPAPHTTRRPEDRRRPAVTEQQQVAGENRRPDHLHVPARTPDGSRCQI